MNYIAAMGGIWRV